MDTRTSFRSVSEGCFPEQLTILAGEPPEIPETQSEANLSDGRLVWTALAQKSAGSMQMMDAKVLDGREAIASLKRGSKSSLGHAEGGLEGRFSEIASHFGGTRNPMVVHWPAGIKAKGEIRDQFHHVIDVVPTILEACKIPEPKVVNGIVQKPIEGVSMVYSFDDAKARGKRTTQYFELVTNRAIYHDGWVACSQYGLPWQTAGRRRRFPHGSVGALQHQRGLHLHLHVSALSLLLSSRIR